jgi:hypothetical protein
MTAAPSFALFATIAIHPTTLDLHSNCGPAFQVTQVGLGLHAGLTFTWLPIQKFYDLLTSASSYKDQIFRPICDVSTATTVDINKDHNMAPDGSRHTYDLLVHLSLLRPILLPGPHPEKTETTSDNHTRDTVNADKQRAIREANRKRKMAPNNSYYARKPTGSSSILEDNKTETTMPHRSNDTADASQ